MRKLFGLILLVGMAPTFCKAQAWSGIIDPSRAVNWVNAGVVGGNSTTGALPSDSWAQCTNTACNTAFATPNAANINSAIAGAPADTYVLLPAGTFTIGSPGITFISTSNVELRGAGANATFLNFTASNTCTGTPASVCFQSTDSNYQGGPSNTANWTAGYTQGSTTITLSAVTNLKVGYPIILDQVDDATDSGDIFLCGTSATCALAGNGGFTRQSPARDSSQTVTVTQCDGNSTVGHACSSGSNITISPGLYMPSWNDHPGTSLPGAWWATTPIFNDGIRNVSLNYTGVSTDPLKGVMFFNCSNCWQSGTRSIMNNTGSTQTHTLLWNSPHVTVQNNYYFHNNQTGSATLYGVSLGNTSDSLVQNNICEQVQACVPEDGPADGSVVAYNFDVNNVYGASLNWLNQAEFQHSLADFMLYEGNEGAGLYSDNFHGAHYFATIFRTAANGFQQNEGNITNSSTTPLQINAYSRFFNLVGNVLGSPALPAATYKTTEPTAPTGTEIVVVGYGDGVANDSNVPRTIMLWGNWDTVTNAVRWCGNSGDPGWSTTCSSTSEVPSGITNYSNAVPASTTLPSSFYLSGTPPWFGSVPYPAIGPDVTSGNLRICHGSTNGGAYVTSSGQCPSSTLDTIGGHANAIPAMNCFLNVMGGSPIGTDASALAFNPGACYPTSNAPAPATALFAKVQ